MLKQLEYLWYSYKIASHLHVLFYGQNPNWLFILNQIFLHSIGVSFPSDSVVPLLFFSKRVLSPSVITVIMIESRGIFANTGWQTINKILLKFQTDYHLRITLENSANCLCHILWASSTGRRLKSLNVFPHPFHLCSLQTFRSKLLSLQTHVEHG